MAIAVSNGWAGKFLAFSLVLAICAVAIPAQAQVTNPVPGDPVVIDTGRVSGTLLDSGVRGYFGLPFAAPPVRELRWRAPQPVKAWSGVYTANTMRAECVQGLRSPSINHYFGEEAASEDCLYLNIWAPRGTKTGAKLPVVVWIYGGAFNVGSASSPIYSGEPLAKKGVIYVAINYRLGVFGFLAHPELTRESGHNASGNWGFLDQVAALQWINRNIAAFGGDPGNVTLVGQSAGSMSINNLQASPLAKGLFQRVFGMSGSTLDDSLGLSTSLAASEAEGLKLQQAMKAATLAAMRGVSSDKVQAMAQAARVRAGPSIDGYYLPASVAEIFAAGRQNDVPVVTGSTANDIGADVSIRHATTVTAYAAAAAAAYGPAAEEFLRLFPAATDAQVKARAAEVGRDSGFGLAARKWVRAQTRTGKTPAYLFMFSRVQPFTPGVTFTDFDPATAGAYHMGDVPYFLGTYESFNTYRTTRDWTPLDRQLSNQLQDLIVAYAKTGTPSTAAITMPRYSLGQELRTDFGDTVHVETLDTAAQDFLAAHPSAQTRPGPPPATAPPTSAPARPTY